MALSAELDALHSSLSCCSYNGSQHTHVLIEERDVLAKLKKVTLLAPPGDWFSFDPDKGRGKPPLMSPLLATGAQHDHHRACDCVVVVNKGGKLTVLYVDLKSESPKGYSGQFKSARQFVRYACGLLKEFHDHDLTVVEERFVVLYGGATTSINKKTTVPKKVSLKKMEPTNPLKREVQNDAKLYLREFLA